MSNMLNQQLEKDKHRGTKSSRKHTAKERASASHAAADAAFEESEFGADRANDADGVNETFGKQDASHNERSPQRQSHAVASVRAPHVLILYVYLHNEDQLLDTKKY